MTSEKTFDENGDMNEASERYVQICPNCGTPNYTDSVDHPVERCCNCRKLRIGKIKPVKEGGESENSNADENLPEQVPAEEQEMKAAEEQDGNEWGRLLEKLELVHPSQKQIILHAVGRFSGFTESFMSDETPVMLGRYACDTLSADDKRRDKYLRCEYHLQQDLRVSGEHCQILCEEGKWYVQDNRSRNSTRINGKVIEKQQINNGDILKLGNQNDSVEFSIEIR